MAAVPNTVIETTWVKPIDATGLAAFAEKGRNNPDSRGTVKSRTVYDGQFRSLTYVGAHTPVVVDEPPHLFGQDTAPAPSEILLSALGGCLCVGIHAVATHKGVNISRMEVLLEGDIGNPAAWGAGGAQKAPHQMGFQAVRAKVILEADASREVLAEIVREADYASPMANCFRNPIPTDVALV
ncbi:MAG: OsmC family peroxiredoxin [Burkholderiales bacterium]|nr:MAG: OsmC family peroxiredoxin [Burkholderiales bacterium]